jgi:hypothetical protein
LLEVKALSKEMHAYGISRLGHYFLVSSFHPFDDTSTMEELLNKDVAGISITAATSFTTITMLSQTGRMHLYIP